MSTSPGGAARLHSGTTTGRTTLPWGPSPWSSVAEDFVHEPETLYTGVSLLVLPWVGFLLDTWLGAALGIVLYIGSRMYAPAEEAALSESFGPAWDEYRDTVKITWL